MNLESATVQPAPARPAPGAGPPGAFYPQPNARENGWYSTDTASDLVARAREERGTIGGERSQLKSPSAEMHGAVAPRGQQQHQQRSAPSAARPVAGAGPPWADKVTARSAGRHPPAHPTAGSPSNGSIVTRPQTELDIPAAGQVWVPPPLSMHEDGWQQPSASRDPRRQPKPEAGVIVTRPQTELDIPASSLPTFLPTYDSPHQQQQQEDQQQQQEEQDDGGMQDQGAVPPLLESPGVTDHGHPVKMQWRCGLEANSGRMVTLGATVTASDCGTGRLRPPRTW